MNAIPEHLRGVITTRRYTNPRLPLPYRHYVAKFQADLGIVYSMCQAALHHDCCSDQVYLEKPVHV